MTLKSRASVCTRASREYVTPQDLFQEVRAEPYPCLLESQAGPGGGGSGRYSLMCADPFAVLSAKGRSVQLAGAVSGGHAGGDVFAVLRTLLEGLRVAGGDALPFAGAAVGYFGYDVGRLIERIPSLAVDDLGLPDVHLCFYDSGFVFDHNEEAVYAVAVDRGSSGNGKPAESRLNDMEALLEAAATRGTQDFCGRRPIAKARSSLSQADYLDAVCRAKEYVAAGDVYQVNLSHRIEAPFAGDPYDLFRRLSLENPAQYAAFLETEHGAIVSSSPELFLSVAGRCVETHPVKGTRPRGYSDTEDRSNMVALRSSEKDRAEHLMIVDLERNDLGRVCDYGSVDVADFMAVESLPTVFHLVSRVVGELAHGRDRVDLLKATFPGGSITGAPKVRAMEIIEELEPTRRGVYTGAIGFMSFNGRMNLNIAIRTAIVRDSRVYFQVGGGIVHDSDPSCEYQETLDKARAMLRAADACL